MFYGFIWLMEFWFVDVLSRLSKSLQIVRLNPSLPDWGIFKIRLCCSYCVSKQYSTTASK